MPNEIRPCTLWGQTFDAMKVVALNEERKESSEHHVRVCISTPHPTNPYDSLCVVLSPHFMPPLEAFRIANNAIAQALNPPIKVTQSVLDAMEKVPEAQYILVDGCTRYSTKWDKDRSLFHIMASVALCVGDYIQADCPLALQVLLDFNEEGEDHA